MVRELFEMARTKKACIIFFDEIDAVGGARFDDGAGGDNEVRNVAKEIKKKIKKSPLNSLSFCQLDIYYLKCREVCSKMLTDF